MTMIIQFDAYAIRHYGVVHNKVREAIGSKIEIFILHHELLHPNHSLISIIREGVQIHHLRFFASA